MPFEDLIPEFRTGKFFRSLSTFSSLCIHGQFYNLSALKTDKVHCMYQSKFLSHYLEIKENNPHGTPCREGRIILKRILNREEVKDKALP